MTEDVMFVSSTVITQHLTGNNTWADVRYMTFYDNTRVLREVLFDIRARNSNFAKVLVKNITMQCTKMKTHTDTCYPRKINKTNHFSPILVTSIHKTDSFRL